VRRRATLVVALGFVAMFASGPGQSFWLSVFVDPILESTGLSRTVFSALYAAGTIVSATAMAFVGRATDRYGLRAAWVLVSLGLASACALTSVAAGAAALLVGVALLRTFGQGSFPLIGTLLVASSFGRTRARALSVSGLGLTAAGLVLPPLGYVLISAVGWRTGLQAVGLAIALLIAPLALLVGSRGRADPVPAEVYATPGRSPWRGSGRFAAWPNRQAALLLFVFTAPPLIVTAVVFHATSLLGARGVAPGGAAAVLTALAGAGLLGTLTAGQVADRFATKVALVIMGAGLTLGVALLLLPVAAFAVAGYVVVGVSNGMYGVANGAAWARAYGTAGLGRIQGLAASTQIAAAAAGPLPLAASLSLTGSYLAGLVCTGILAVACTLAALKAADTRHPAGLTA
jgi:MFS family permease